MKTLRLSCVLLILFTSFGMSAQTYMDISTISVSPASPTTNDAIQIVTSGYLSNTNVVVNSAVITTSGTNVYISFVVTASGIGGPVVIPYNHTFNLAPLSAGTYQIIIQDQFVYDSAPAEQHVFTVTQSTTGTCQANFSFILDTSYVGPLNSYKYLFTDLSTSSSNIATWSWTFGDGGTSGLQDPFHIYNTISINPFIVCLTITTTTGCNSTYCDTLHPGQNSVNCNALFTVNTTAVLNTYHFVDQSVSSGTITAWHWNFGDGDSSLVQSPDHHYQNAGTYTISLTINTSDNCNNTSYYTLVVGSPCNFSVNLAITNVTVWAGSDGQIHSTVINGLSPYLFTWSNGASTQNLLNITAGNYSVTVIDSNGCVASGSAVVTQPPAPVSQTINIISGWSIISTYIIPPQPAVSTVVAGILSNIIIIKDGSGNVYWPQYGINNIGNFVIGKGYQIKTSAACSLTVSGSPVVPESTPVQIIQGWSIIGYLRMNQGNVETIMNPVINNVLIVKNGAGHVYWPYYGLDNLIHMNPGEGFQVYATATCTLVYPAN
ncbi:MAG: PKD domain-containing protein [Bacteroidia bacterium]|nr:PKD domain-containing protein [Bacteroidia bacterium]